MTEFRVQIIEESVMLKSSTLITIDYALLL